MKQKIAIIGAGIAGLGAAYALRDEAELVVYEKRRHPGGHAQSYEVRDPATGALIPIDTAFTIYVPEHYPRFAALLDQLGVPTRPVEAGISVSDEATGIELNLPHLASLLTQRENLLSPAFWKLIREIKKFHAVIAQPHDGKTSPDIALIDYVRSQGHAQEFLHHYLIPLTSAEWNTPADNALLFPAATLIAFCNNYGFANPHTHWRSVVGTSSAYVRKLVAALKLPPDGWRHGAMSITRLADGGVSIRDTEGHVDRFDKVIVAVHPDQALHLLHPPSTMESVLLGAIKCREHEATLHTDESVMPRNRRVWSGWNYRAHRGANEVPVTATHYWMNRLDALDTPTQYFLTLGAQAPVAPEKILRRIGFTHLLFSHEALHARAELPLLNRAEPRQSVFFCGSYFGRGFHEDALKSGQEVAAAILLGN